MKEEASVFYGIKENLGEKNRGKSLLPRFPNKENIQSFINKA